MNSLYFCISKPEHLMIWRMYHMEWNSQKVRKLAPENDPLKIGMGVDGGGSG